MASTPLALLCLVFVASGAAGLIYESVWSRYLGLFVGHTAYAQVIVLSIFLGGMAAGALIAGRRSESLRDPLRWYAGIELAVGAAGLLFHAAYAFATGLAHTVLFPALGESALLVPIKWMIAALLILPQSVLLGATFPLMTAAVVRLLPERAGRTIALLYFANSLGAAGGVLIAGFLLIAWGGLPGAIETAAILNLAAAAAAWGVARTLVPGAATTPVAATAVAGRRGADERIATLLLAVAFGTAVASFFYEIAWIRMLSLVLGSATHSFELMLSAFILGLALGALWSRRFVDRRDLPLVPLAWVQWLMGAAALATLPVYIESFEWLAALMRTFDRTPEGYVGFNLARYSLCLAVMLPSTVCAGMTLPLLTKSVLSSGLGERAIGSVYGVNTLGSIVGVVTAALVLMPLVGLKALLLLGAGLDMALGVVLFARAGVGSRAPIVAAAAAVAVTAAAAQFTELDRTVLASGVFRGGQVPEKGAFEMLFYRDGRTATVAVARNAWRGDVTLSTNGKPDASLSPEWFSPETGGERVPLVADNATQVLLSLIALAYKPEARTAAIVGLGSGSSTHFLLASPVLERVVTIEIEPAIIEAARQFHPVNRRAYDDPRGVNVVADAKTYFAAAAEPFDLILSEPSNPWVSGVASLFTSEFYEAAARRLAPGGIFAQWLHLYEIDDDLVLHVLAALHLEFPSYEIFQVGPGDVVIIASKESRLPAPDWAVLELPAVVEDMRRFVAFTPAALEATRLLDRAALAPLFDLGVQANSDFFPILDLGAERARFLQQPAAGFRALAGERFDLTAPIVGRRPLGGETVETVAGDERIAARARSARLRTARDAGTLAALAATDDANAAHRLSVWQRLLATGEPPDDWRRWIADTLIVEADLHGGSAGVADETFHAQARAYAERHQAPPAAADALAFVEGLARWDFPRVARAADRLLGLTLQGQPWVPPDLLLEGAVLANLRLGRADAARDFYEKLAAAAYPDPRDLRRRLLGAYVTLPDRVVFAAEE
jgi:spermidine synthase/MFS family permease